MAKNFEVYKAKKVDKQIMRGTNKHSIASKARMVHILTLITCKRSQSSNT